MVYILLHIEINPVSPTNFADGDHAVYRNTSGIQFGPLVVIAKLEIAIQ